jgi:hypothetical protein
MKLAAILEKANSIRQVSPPSFSVYYFWLPLLIYILFLQGQLTLIIEIGFGWK